MGKVERLRSELHEVMAECNYDLTDERVVSKSQELDKALNEFGGINL